MPSAPMMRPAIIRSRISWFVPARRFWLASASCDAESLIISAFWNVVSAPPSHQQHDGGGDEQFGEREAVLRA